MCVWAVPGNRGVHPARAGEEARAPLPAMWGDGSAAACWGCRYLLYIYMSAHLYVYYITPRVPIPTLYICLHIYMCIILLLSRPPPLLCDRRWGQTGVFNRAAGEMPPPSAVGVSSAGTPPPQGGFLTGCPALTRSMTRMRPALRHGGEGGWARVLRPRLPRRLPPVGGISPHIPRGRTRQLRRAPREWRAPRAYIGRMDRI